MIIDIINRCHSGAVSVAGDGDSSSGIGFLFFDHVTRTRAATETNQRLPFLVGVGSSPGNDYVSAEEIFARTKNIGKQQEKSDLL